jgi:cell volume regulation protein A
MPLSIEFLLLFLSVLFLISLFATKAGSRFGVPVLLLFLGIGMVFGTDGLGFEFQNYTIAQAIGTLALCIILFSGGLDTKYRDIKPVFSAPFSFSFFLMFYPFLFDMLTALRQIS